ncbi:MAG: hypothetical protein KDA61_19565 [Planctomycetales bacterium]|nr:hypothetical protein [Planctomycetales bacterium]
MATQMKQIRSCDHPLRAPDRDSASFTLPRHYLPGRRGVRPFELFGSWGEASATVHAGAGLTLIRWLALHAQLADDVDRWWAACRRANPACFQTFQTVRLAAASFFLPPGPVVFEVIENPAQIPDNPPRGVMMRHWEAMSSFPEATFYFLRPVFTCDPELRLFTPADLAEEVRLDRDNALFSARLYGPAIRASHFAAHHVCGAASVCWARAKSFSAALAKKLEPSARTRAREALREIDPARLPHGFVREVEREFRLGAETDVEAVRRATQRLREHQAIDPVLCFELPRQPGKLWFEAHWFDGRDGKRYVHY